MQATIEAIKQDIELYNGKKMTTSIRVRLPDGTVFFAAVDEVVVEQLLRLMNNEPGSAEVSPPTISDSEVFGGMGATIEPEEDPDVDWAVLPDSHLSPQMKKTLRELGLSQVMRVSELVAIVDKISEQQMAKAQERAQQQPGQLVPVPRARTVQKDDAGYPVVPGHMQDPGEVAHLNSDEDGVPQL
jgi:hypothetical protein